MAGFLFKLFKMELNKLFDREYMLLSLIDNIVQNQSFKIRKEQIRLKGSYPFIPINIPAFFESLIIVRELLYAESTNGLKFIDYGCGIGITMLIARKLGFEISGIEYDDKIIENSLFSIYEPKNPIIKGDLTDKKLYKNNQYDVVYYYSPFEDYMKEVEFELNAISTVKIGGYIIAPPPGRMVEYLSNYKSEFKWNLNNGDIEQSKIRAKFFNEMKNFERIKSEHTTYHHSIFKRIK